MRQQKLFLSWSARVSPPTRCPRKDEKVLIQRNGNVAFDVSDHIHPSVAAAALAARVVGLDIAGVDLVLEDISRPLAEQRGAVIEVNASPRPAGPPETSRRPAASDWQGHHRTPVRYRQRSGRIPVVGVTGTQDTTRIARLIAWLLHISGKQVGLACRDGFYLGARQVDASDSTHWEGGQRLLINRSVEVAVFEHSSRMILSEGLAYDKCMVGVVTDVSGFEALTEFYIDDLDKLYNVVRTQVDVVLPQGTAVLNAADPQVVEMAHLCDGKVIFYGLDPQLEAITTHRASGERVLFVHDGHIVLAQRQ